METYTRDIHAERLERMLNKNNPCVYCPATPRFSQLQETENFWYVDYYMFGEDPNHPCRICRRFIGLKSRLNEDMYKRCPCHTLGPEKAIKNSLKAIKQYKEKHAS